MMFSRASSSALTNCLRRHALASTLQPQYASSLLVATCHRSFGAAPTNNPKKKKLTKIKTKSGNIRGSRGHGWLHHYRNGGGGRHLQGDYADGRRPPVEELQAWNQQVLQMGHVTVYFDVTVGADAIDTTTSNTTEQSEGEKIETLTAAESASSTTSVEAAATTTSEPSFSDEQPEKQPEEQVQEGQVQQEEQPKEEEEEIVIEQHRLYMDVATSAMPMTTRNFLELCQQSNLGYTNTVMTRLDKRVGLVGGDVISNTGRRGRCATAWFEPQQHDTNDTNTANTTATTTISETYLLNPDRHIMTHIGGTISMLCPKVRMVDSRFIIITQPDAPHLDGYHMAFGQLHPESLAVVQSWVKTIFTRQGHPLTELKIVACGVGKPGDANNNEQPAEEGDGEKAA